MTSDSAYDPWPVLSGPAFAPTRHFLHMVLQAVGKLKLSQPFQAQWAEVPLWLNARGLTTGPIPYARGAYEVRADFVTQQLHWLTSEGKSGCLAFGPTSVAAFVDGLLKGLRNAGIDASINMKPQEIPDPIPFDEDTQPRAYDPAQVATWWRILLSVQRLMQAFQGRFTGKTQPIGLMWGTFDIRLPFYSGKPAQPAPDSGFIRRNCMNVELMEMGWWPGDGSYPRPAFYAFTYPQPSGIERAKIGPNAARWDATMGEFLLDYDDLRQCAHPDGALLEFFASTYAAGANAAHWDPSLLGTGRTV